MIHPHRNTRRTTTSLAMLLVAACATGRPRVGCAQAVWELTPYQFHVYVAADRMPEIPDRALDELGRELIDRVDSTIGAAWRLTASQPEPALRQAMLTNLEGVAVAALPQEILAKDKVTLVTITPGVIGFHLAARELDVRTQNFSAVVQKDVFQAALLADSLFSAVIETFTPLASIRSNEGDKAELRLRAGRLPPRDTSLLAVQAGAVFLPVIRYDDRDGKPKKILPLPWTYLAVEEADQARLDCRIYSGLHSALAGRRRGRVQELAVAVKPPARPTRLVIRARTGSSRPLGGYDVFLQKPGEKSTAWLGRTDLAGSILIPPAPYPLQLLYIRNGGQLLARLPLVPGIEDSVEAAVIDDDQRLAAEGAIMSAQEELLDVVTRRAVLAARIAAAIKAGKADEADAMLVEVYALRTRDQFTQHLDQQRQKLRSEDPLINRRIDMMFDKVHKLAVQYLDPREVDKLGEQVRAAKAEAGPKRS